MTISPPIAHPQIKEFLEERVNLEPDVAKERRRKVGELRDKLSAWMKDHPDCGFTKSYLSGSLAKGTALRTSSDVDLALYIKHDGERKASRELSDWIADRLRQAYPQMQADQITPHEYAVTITYKSANVDIDVVPVFDEGDENGKGWLVSQRTGRLMLTSIPMHLDFIRKRKASQPKHFAQVVRLIKWWANEQKAANADFRFKSFIIELILAHLADRGQSMADYPAAATAFFNYVVTTGLKNRIAFTDYYPASQLPECRDVMQVVDPVNPDNNAASQYTDHNRALIVEAAHDALDALNEAHTAATKGHAVAMWQEILSNSFRG